ncbi:MAG: BTAD domain-containing putative transcriptional regulator [Ktedonobacteraceae bacterium]
MTTDRIQHKIQTPTLPVPILHREEVVHLLAEAMGSSQTNQVAPYKLILLCAPAGYGKTTLLASTIQRLSITCCWYILEHTDTPALFFKVLLVSIRSGFPNFGRHLDALFSIPDDARECWDDLIEVFIEALDNEISQQFVLVFCNYHRIRQNGTINHLVNQLLERFPQQGILVIESRSLPNLELAPLIARRQMFGLGSNRLCFNAEEICDLAHMQGFSSFSLQEAEHLTRSFEGWITGVLLGSDLGYTQLHPLTPSRKGTWGTPALLADRKSLATYITKEIFWQERATLEFLEAVSILDQLTPEHCNALLEIANAAEQLVYAEQQGLFVVRTDESSGKGEIGVYRCHPILRELFREQLRRSSFERYLTLQRRAAQIFQQDKAYSQALMHALLAQEYDQAIRMMIPLASDLIEQGQDEMVAGWLRSVPESLAQQHPWLSLIHANLHLIRNEYAHVAPLLNVVEASLEKPSLEQDSSSRALLQAELKLARSKLVFYQGKFQAAQELCQQVLDLLPMNERCLRTRAHQRLGVCLIVGQGRIHEGLVQLQQALHLSGPQKEERQTATLHRLLASAYGWVGNYILADYHQTRTLQICEKLNDSWGVTSSLTSMGLLQLRQGLTQEAEKTLTKALHWARDVCHFKSGEAYALVALGEFYCTLANPAQALPYLEEGLRLARQCEDSYLAHCSLCSLATTYLFLGETQMGQFFLDQIFLKEQKEQSYEGLLYHLTQGMIWLAQQTYNQAQQEIERAVALGKSTNIQFLYMQALLLQSVCFSRQKKTEKALQAIGQAIELNKKGDFDYVMQVTIRRYPDLPALFNHEQLEQRAAVPTIPFKQPLPPSTPEIQSVIEHLGEAQSLYIQAFGEPKVLVDATPITRWHLTRSLELFFLLLEKAHPVQKDLLIDALWPNTANHQIDTTLRTAIYYARQALGKNCITYRLGLYSLDLPTTYKKQIQYDVALFEDYYSQAKQLLEDEDDDAANKAFSNMVALYTGDYLQSFYNDWCSSRRDQLRQAYLNARQQLAFIAWRGERWEESLHHWHCVLIVDACSQKAHYGLMRCYLRQGKRELALRQYQICAQNLQEELHILPEKSLQKLYQRIIQANESVDIS